MVLILEACPDMTASTIAGGTAWLNSEHWDLAPKLPPDMPADEKQLNHRTELMLQSFLADRFKLKVHRESRNTPVYALIRAKLTLCSTLLRFMNLRVREGFALWMTGTRW